MPKRRPSRDPDATWAAKSEVAKIQVVLRRTDNANRVVCELRDFLLITRRKIGLLKFFFLRREAYMSTNDSQKQKETSLGGEDGITVVIIVGRLLT